MSKPMVAQAARTAAHDAQIAANFVAEVADKVETVKAGLPSEDPIPSFYAHIGDDDIIRTKKAADAGAAEAVKAADEAELAEKAGNTKKAEAAAAKAEQGLAKANLASEETESLVEKAEIDEDEFEGPPDEELSDPDNIYGISGN